MGERYRCVGYVEREAYAASVLVARMEDATMDRAPIWDDLESFPGALYRGSVDLVSAGFPCQPWSSAGAGLGASDARWLWSSIAKLLREVEPALLFLENVPPIVSGGGLALVLGSLAELGFDAEWDLFSAHASGAPHLRRRFFLLAAHADRLRELEPGWPIGAQRERPRDGDRWPPESGLPRVADGSSEWVAESESAAGGAVVPAVAARAFCVLSERMSAR
jgi:DNA (cytosine-5)-methyltransferase 1